MTILNKILIFNEPQKDIECFSCKGTGKVKTQSTSSGTQIFTGFVTIFTAMISLSMVTKPSVLKITLFIVGTITVILMLREYKIQKGGN